MRLSFISKIAIPLVLFLAARTGSADVLKVVVDDTIHPLIVEHFDRAIQEAQRTHADALPGWRDRNARRSEDGWYHPPQLSAHLRSRCVRPEKGPAGLQSSK